LDYFIEITQQDIRSIDEEALKELKTVAMQLLIDIANELHRREAAK
jgi:hypothetical protein